MTFSTLGLVIVLAPIVIFFLMLIGVIWVMRRQRKTKWPFKTEDKLLRGPGEDLKQRITGIDERLVFEMMGGICVGLLLPSLFVGPLHNLTKLTPEMSLWLGYLAMGMTYGFSGWKISRLWRRRQNCYLGWFAERYVAEWLEPAKINGWQVFHDVPFTNNGVKFNIDHVVLGLGGILIVETKTRRKGNARPGREDNTVFFNGRTLDWPWGEDTHGLEQAERNALWLTDWIRSEIGERVYVAPVLAIPGWWLEIKPCRDARLCRVVNPKWLPGLLAKERSALTQKQIELISLRLEAKCRDVEE